MIGARRAVTMLAVACGACSTCWSPRCRRGGAASATAVLLALVGARVLMGARPGAALPHHRRRHHLQLVSGIGLGPPELAPERGRSRSAPPRQGRSSPGSRCGSAGAIVPAHRAAGFLTRRGLVVVRARLPVRSTRKSTRPSARLIDAGRTAGHALAPDGAPGRGARHRDHCSSLTAGYFCSNYVFYFFFNWLFVYLIENRGFKLLEGGFVRLDSLDHRRRRRGLRRLALRPALEADRRAVGLPRTGSGRVALAAMLPAGRRGCAPHPLVAVLLLSLCLAAQQFSGCDLLGRRDRGGRPAPSAACG